VTLVVNAFATQVGASVTSLWLQELKIYDVQVALPDV